LPTHENLHYPCVENFVDAIVSGAPLRSSGATALMTDWVTEQAITANARRHDNCDNRSL